MIVKNCRFLSRPSRLAIFCNKSPVGKGTHWQSSKIVGMNRRVKRTGSQKGLNRGKFGNKKKGHWMGR